MAYTYEQMLNNARKLVATNGGGLFDQYDVVHEAYVLAAEDNSHDISSYLKTAHHRLKDKYRFHDNYTDSINQKDFIKGDVQCKKCNKVLPASMFQTRVRENGIVYRFKLCTECESKRKKQYKYKGNPERLRIARQELAEWYIVAMLRQKDKNLIVTDEMVAAKREQIIQLRKKKQNG